MTIPINITRKIGKKNAALQQPFEMETLKFIKFSVTVS